MLCGVIIIIMNPLVKTTTEKILGHEIRPEDMSIAVIIGNAIYEALSASKHNPNFNLKGGTSIDENTIGNFDVPDATQRPSIKNRA